MRSLLRTLFYKLIRLVVDREVARSTVSVTFPTAWGQNYLQMPLFPSEDGAGFFTRIFSENLPNPLAVSYGRLKLEVLRGKFCAKGHPHRVEIETPYAVTNVDDFKANGEYSTRFRFNREEHQFRNLVAERYYYLPLREKGVAEFLSDYDLIVGDPIPLVQRKRHKRRQVVMIFVDSFTWQIQKRISPEIYTPNIHRFFSDGMTFDNCYSNSNWTVPSVASIVSGKSIRQHGMFHPRKDIIVGDGYPIASEIFQDDGYLTLQVCGNWRKSPSYGYAKGFDRTIYKGNLSLGETVCSTLDHMRAFPDRDQFTWVSIFDLHHPVSLVPNISSQLAIPLKAQDYDFQDTKTPLQLEPSETRTLRFMEELKRVDFYLGILFDYLTANYDDDELLVAICADHGTTYFTEDSKNLPRERCNVAFMVKGGDVPAGRSDEMVQGTDILPTLLKFSDIAFDGEIDGRVPAALGGPAPRDYAFTEVLFPGVPYEISVKDKQFDFYLRTDAPVGDDGQVDLSDLRTGLYRIDEYTTDVSNEHAEIAEAYKQAVVDYHAENPIL